MEKKVIVMCHGIQASKPVPPINAEPWAQIGHKKVRKRYDYEETVGIADGDPACAGVRRVQGADEEYGQVLLRRVRLVFSF